MRISDWSSDVCSSDLVLVSLIKASGIQDRIIVQSFHAAGIDRVKALDPTIRTVYLTASEPGAEAALDHAIQQGHEIVAPSHNLSELDAAYVDRAHAGRSDERRVGKECVSTCISGGSPDH